VPFVNLHNHTSYSALDGASKISELVAAAAADNQPGLSINDHGVCWGLIDFYKECKKQGINPILGSEFYHTDHADDRGVKIGDGTIDGTDKRYYHLTVFAENDEGYRNLIKLSSVAFENFWYKPRSTWETLEQHSKGLIVTTGCLGGPVLQRLLRDDYDGALAVTQRMVDICGAENVFVELQDHGLPEQHKTNPWLIDIAKKLNLNVVACADSHYVTHDDAVTHDSLLCLQTQSKIADTDRFRFQGDQYYLKTSDEMRLVFAEIPEACDNTLLINERCNVKIDFDTLHLPKFPVPDGYDSASAYLSHLVYKGLLERYENPTTVHLERLAYELGVIDTMGVSAYFLIVWDLMQFAKRQGIRRGPGRGSAAGSLCSYLLKITDIDPIKYNLPFERFLNPSRVSMPDIDLDMETDRRDELINYTIEKYGRDHVAQVITFSEIRARSAVRDAARILDLPPQVGDKIAKAMPELHMGEPTPLYACMEHYDRYDFGYKNAEDVRNLYDADPQAKQVIDVAMGLEGLIRQDGIGAAAVVITPEPLTNFVPTQQKPDGPLITQYEKSTIEELGLLKMDFLGLRNLDIIENTLKMINYAIDIDNLPLDDPSVYKMLSDGDTVGVFQLQESGCRSLLRRLQPRNIEDLAAVLALYRPGPMASNMHLDYADRRNGRQAVTYFHPDAEEILSATYGICLFQEQLMRVAQKFAGYSMADADILRKIIGKKLIDQMIEERKKFIDGCVSRGYSEELGGQIFDMIEGFASYGFSANHAFPYSFISYQTAYLKAHYPAEFMAATCASVSTNIEKSSVYLYEARKMGLKVSTPDINKSDYNFTAVDGEILVGLGSLRNVGVAARKALEERSENGPFTSLVDFLQRVNPNLRELKSLAQGGALDAYGTRLGIVSVAEDLLNHVRKSLKKQQESLFDTDEFFDVVIPTHEYPLATKMALEKEVIGIYVSGHPLDGLDPGEFTIADLYDLDDVWADITCIVSTVDLKTTRAGDRMAKLVVEDQTGTLEVVIFPKSYAQIKAPKVGDVVEIGLRVGRDRDQQRNYILNKWKKIETNDRNEVDGEVLKFYLPKGFAQDSVALSQLKGILLDNRGSVPVGFYISRSTTLALSEEFYVDNSDKLKDEVKALFSSYSSR